MNAELLAKRVIGGVVCLCFLALPFPAEALKKNQSKVLEMLGGSEDNRGPVAIESDEARFDKKAGIVLYSGHVVIKHGKMRITSERLKGFLDKQQKEIDYLIAEGDVKVVKGDRTVEAKKAIFYRGPANKERLELEGDTVIYMQNKSISADKMTYYLASDRFEAEGRVRAVFDRQTTENAPSEPTKAVVITSEEVDYDTKANSARFLRNVKVNYSDMVLSAQKLQVFLEKELNKIEKIVAQDHVKILQKDKEITSDQCVFYDKEKKIVLTGNPVSRQGENVLSGQEMVYYLDSETVEIKKAKTVFRPKDVKKGSTSFFPTAPGM